MTPAAESAYVAAVLMLYLDLPDTPLRPGSRDQWLARRLHQQGVPLSLVESALLLASLRRLIRPADLPPLPPIRSLAYFQPVIDELQQLDVCCHVAHLAWQRSGTSERIAPLVQSASEGSGEYAGVRK